MPDLDVPRWYTLDDLADRWCISTETVRHWLQVARAAGHGPAPEQADRRRIGRGGRTRLLLRADYCLALHERQRGLGLRRHARRVENTQDGPS